jgi:hypothetical protein
MSSIMGYGRSVRSIRALILVAACTNAAAHAASPKALKLLPYPQEVKLQNRQIRLGPLSHKSPRAASATEQIAVESLRRYLPRQGDPIAVRLGSAEEGYEPQWLTKEQRAFLANPATNSEASVLVVAAEGITVVGKGKWGMLYGVQTVNQLAVQAAREQRDTIPCLTIHDWPDAAWRCLAPQLAWYAGWGSRFEGYDNGNWTLDEWRWMVDWSLLHKCNAWAVCMYGKWPFSLPGYEADTLDFDSFYYDIKTGKKTPYHYTHRNIKKEFLPELIRYANARGVQVHAYIGKNTFNGTYIQRHPEADAKSLVKEALPFTPGVHEYWSAFIKRILESGFNGFVFEDPESYFVPNQNELCYKTFWQPWAKKYDFRAVTETNPYKPPLGVHLEYYTWLFREFDQLIRKHAASLGRPKPAIYLISHILLDRIMKESKDPEERARWFALIDEKHGRKVPFVLFEDREKDYVRLLGKDRAATLGGRGGAASGCWRLANINNDRMHGDLGMDLAEERAKQRRMVEAGGLGSMIYTFQWSNTEVFGYLGAQYVWKHDGVPGINNEDDFGFMDYAYRFYYGDAVGALVAKAYSVNSCVTEFHVLEDGQPVIFFGGPLHRDFQLLVVLADEADRLAQEAYKLFTGRAPDLHHAFYDPEKFHWNGYDAAADKLFKTERLRLLCVSTRRAQELCAAAWSLRRAKQRIAEGAPIAAVYDQFNRAVDAARASELLYFANYKDHYTVGNHNTTDIRKKLEAMRSQFLADCGVKDAESIQREQPVPETVRKANKRHRVISWEKQTDVVPAQPSAVKAGHYLSTDLGLSKDIDFFCLGAVFTVQARGKSGGWRTIFRRALLKKDAGWQHWDIPLDGLVEESGTVTLRLITDAYSRAIDRNAPTWKWGYWGQPQIVQLTASGKREVRYDLIDHLADAKLSVQLDDSGNQRPFDGKGTDSTGARFQAAGPGRNVPEPVHRAIAAFTPRAKGSSGVTIAEFSVRSMKTTNR